MSVGQENHLMILSKAVIARFQLRVVNPTTAGEKHCYHQHPSFEAKAFAVHTSAT